jgi:hypothetical protein
MLTIQMSHHLSSGGKHLDKKSKAASQFEKLDALVDKLLKVTRKEQKTPLHTV